MISSFQQQKISTRIEENDIQFALLNRNDLVDAMACLLRQRIQLDLADALISFLMLSSAEYILYTTRYSNLTLVEREEWVEAGLLCCEGLWWERTRDVILL